MGISYNPSVAGDGLVFYYDMANTQKSWKGKPTINYISNPSEEMARGEFGQYRDLAPIFDTYGLVPYSLSMDIKTNIAGNVNVYMQNGSSTKYGFVSSSVNATPTWQRFYFNNITPFISNALDTAATLATYTGYGSGVNPTVRNIQLELGSYSTPFISGTRSNTQAILDLVGNNTLTASSLTYTANNEFSFNGTNNYMSATGTGLISGMSAYTIMFWAKKDAEGKMPVSSLTGTNFYWYGDSSWRYTHGGTGGEYYYPKPTTINLGAWGHYCAVYNGSNVSIYRQGIFQGSQSTTGTADWSTGMKIGDWNGGVGYEWQGKIDSVGMYNRALSATEVYNNFIALKSRYGL